MTADGSPTAGTPPTTPPTGDGHQERALHELTDSAGAGSPGQEVQPLALASQYLLIGCAKGFNTVSPKAATEIGMALSWKLLDRSPAPCPWAGGRAVHTSVGCSRAV